MKSLKPYPNFDLLDDAGGLILAAFIITITLGLPGLFLIGTGPTATTIGIALLIIPSLLITTAAIVAATAITRFVIGEALNSVQEIRSERQRHLHYQNKQNQYRQQAQTKEQQRQVIIELERRENEKRSHPNQMQ